mgnify:CR=1 FL=1
MRKNLAKHTAKKLPLAKRVLALCFALIFVCSCLLPAFANGTGEGLDTPGTEVVEAADPGTEPEPMDLYDEPEALDDNFAVADEPAALDDDFAVADEPAAMDDDFAVADDPAAMDDQVEKPVVDDEPAAMDDQVEKPVVDDEPAAMDNEVEKPVEGGEPPVADDTPAEEGATKTTTDASGNIVYEYDTSGTTFPEDDAAALPDGDQMQVDAAFSIPTNIYHFWLKKMSSYDLADIAADAETAEMTVEQYLAMYGTEKGCYHIMTAADGANLKDYQFADPTSNDDPEGNSRTFAGWYYTDDLGDEQKFVFDEHLYVSEGTTVEVYAKWKDEAAEKTEKYKGWYNELLNASDDYTLESLATEYFNDEGFKKYLATLSENEYVELAEKLEIETYTDFAYEMDEDEDEYGIALLALGPDSADNQKVVYVGGTATLRSNKGVYSSGTHNWTSNNTSVATVSSSDRSGNQTYTATVKGVRAGTVVITHTFTDYWGNVQKDTVTLQVTASSEDALSSYYLYCYTLIPGKTVNSSGTPDSVWNGMGVGSITGLGKPGSNHKDKVVLDNGYGSTAGVMITYPTEYPDITYNGTTYKYAKTEEEKYKEGFYTITWFRVVQDNGANAGNNGYNPVVDTANYPYKRTYHLDGQITLNENDIVAIDFKLKDAGSSTFELVNPETYSRRVDKNTVLGTLTNPSLKVPTEYDRATYPQTKLVNGITYEFVGWYDNEEFTGDPVNFNSYQVTGHTTFYGKYVPKDTIEEDKSFITVEKHITGIDESQIDENFYVQVGNRFLKKNTATVEKKEDGTIILRWTIPDVGEGTYDIGEANQWVEGYIVKQGGDFGSSVEVKAKTFTVDPVGKIINSCSNRDLKVGVEGDYNFIFVVSENSKNRKNVVISKEPLSLSQRNAVVNALGKVGSTFSGQDTVFYSIKDNNEVVIDRTHLTYSSNGEVHIGDTSQWNKALQLKYNVTEGNNPEVKVTNDYTPNSSDLTVTKTVTGLLGDHEKQFSFKLSFNQTIDAEKLAKITWTKSDGTNGTLADQTYTFTLAHGQNIVFQGIPADVTATVTEESYKNYTTKYKIHDTDKLELFDWSSPIESNAASVTINATAQTIQFLNQNDAEPDMGVLLDTLPYILILVVVVGGGVLLFLRKRKNDDDE